MVFVASSPTSAALPYINTASLSGTAMASLGFHLYAHGAMLGEATLYGRVETTEELSDSDAVIRKTHLVIQRWEPRDGTATPSVSQPSDLEIVVGIARMRKRSPHVLTAAEVSQLRSSNGIVLLITEMDPEQGSNALDTSLFQLKPGADAIVSIPFTISNLIASANRYDAIANTVIRFGAVVSKRHASVAAPQRAEIPPLESLTEAYERQQLEAVSAQVAEYSRLHIEEMRLMRELDRLLASASQHPQSTCGCSAVPRVESSDEDDAAEASECAAAGDMLVRALNASASLGGSLYEPPLGYEEATKAAAAVARGADPSQPAPPSQPIDAYF